MMKDLREIQNRIDILEAVIEEIYNELDVFNPSAQHEADAESFILKLRSKIEALKWVLN